MTYTLIKVHFEDSHLQHSIVVTGLAQESGGPNSILTPLHVYFKVWNIERAHFTKYRDSLPFSHNELSNADPLDFLIRSSNLYVKTDLILESLYDT